MNPNRNCQNWRFRQFWSISWKFDDFRMLKVSKLTILGKSDNLHGNSLGLMDVEINKIWGGWDNWFQVDETVKITIFRFWGWLERWYIWFSISWRYLKIDNLGCWLSTTNSGYRMEWVGLWDYVWFGEVLEMVGSEFSGTSKIGVSLGIGDVLLVRPSTTRLGRWHARSGHLDAVCTSGCSSRWLWFSVNACFPHCRKG